MLIWTGASPKIHMLCGHEMRRLFRTFREDGKRSIEQDAVSLYGVGFQKILQTTSFFGPAKPLPRRWPRCEMRRAGTEGRRVYAMTSCCCCCGRRYPQMAGRTTGHSSLFKSRLPVLAVRGKAFIKRLPFYVSSLPCRRSAFGSCWSTSRPSSRPNFRRPCLTMSNHVRRCSRSKIKRAHSGPLAWIRSPPNSRWAWSRPASFVLRSRSK